MARRRRSPARRRRSAPPRHAARPVTRKPARHAPTPRTPARSAHRPSRPRRRAVSELAQLEAALAVEPDLTRALDRLLTAARRVSRAEAGTIYVRRGDVLDFVAVQNDVLAQRVGEDEIRRRVGGRPLPLGENSIASYVVLTRSTVNLRDAYTIPVDRPYTLFRQVDRQTDYRTRSMLAMPLRDAGGRVFGVLQLINARDGRGTVRAFGRDAQRKVEQLAALTARLPGATAG